MKGSSRQAATRRTVLIAGAANLLVGIVKLTAGIMAGSSALLAETAHSAADTLDQAGTERHGHGRPRGRSRG
jgi:divalent metal cation (Fe/Co/Zn/Cd) transporter